MQIVVRGTHTIQEYLQEQKTLQETADKYNKEHKPTAQPTRCWRSIDGTVWIEYENGQAVCCE